MSEDAGCTTENPTWILHRTLNAGRDTKTFCGRADEWFGPHPDASMDVDYCPYCGNEVDDGLHRVDPEIGEVFCENTTQSTWRYCPSCGDKTDE